jgi:mRNA-degrading endonuclease toxin of MazEF toxin-antitoxin module
VRVPTRDTGLRDTSYANFAQVYTVDRRILQHQIGRVPDQLMTAMDDTLRRVLAL